MPAASVYVWPFAVGHASAVELLVALLCVVEVACTEELDELLDTVLVVIVVAVVVVVKTVLLLLTLLEPEISEVEDDEELALATCGLYAGARFGSLHL